MTAKEAKEVLIKHNKWRQAMPPYDEIGSWPNEPEEITQAMEIAIKALCESEAAEYIEAKKLLESLESDENKLNYF